MNPSSSPAVLLLLACLSASAEPLTWTTRPGFRTAPLAVPTAGKTGFTLMPPAKTGVTFTNLLSEAQANANRILDNGSGVALGDVDSDGWCDIYFCNLNGRNVLYRNVGDWHFEDVTQAAGVACEGNRSTGAVFADVDGDGDLDLLVNGIGTGTRLFLNDGRGHFSEVNAPGLVRKYGSTSLALADVDGDGDLDLYVTNYRTDTIRDAPPGVKAEFFRSADGRVTVEPADRFRIIHHGAHAVQLIERGEPDFLYLNDGNGRFTPVAWTNGAFLDERGRALANPPLSWGLSVAFRDLNGDGAPDIYVCNDFNLSPDQVWINDGHGRFRALPNLAMREMPWSSMSVDFADINRDGHVDVFVAEMLSREHQRRQTQRMNFHPELMALPFALMDNRPEYMRNTLFLNRGDSTFAEIAQLAGVDASEWSWSAVFLDVDLDGYEDLLIANGSNHDVLDSDISRHLQELDRAGRTGKKTQVLSMFPALKTSNLAFRNLGNLSFQEVGQQWGFDLAGVSTAMALADLDNDGDLDVVINNLNGPATLLRNDTTAPRVAVRLAGRAPNTRGIGAQIAVTGGPVSQTQEMMAGGRYLSCDQNLRTFAAGSLTNELRIVVTWRNGTQSVVDHAAPNQIYEVDEPSASPTAARMPEIPLATPPPLFQDVSALLNHSHHEQEFDDFIRQPLLPKKLSQLGPGISWFDVNSDGWEDLIIGSGRGGKLAVLGNQAGAGFKPLHMAVLEQPVTRAQTTVLGWHSGNNETALLAGSSNYEDGLSAGSCARLYNLAQDRVENSLPGQQASTGPLALADYDGDGELDLFVGGRVIGGRYPEPTSSLLFHNQRGSLILDTENSAHLAKVGLVSGALFSDLDGDGFPELILACEWGPIRVFHNRQGSFIEITEQLGLSACPGWWNGVTTGDFDGDGKLDIAASNWGRNSKYESKRADGLRLYFGDLSGNATVDLFEAYFDRGLNKVVPWRAWDVLGSALPFLRERYSSFHAFATAGIEDIFAERKLKMTELRAVWLDSTVFLNRGDHFEPVSLPVEAQFAPAFGIVTGDFNGDGNQDLFLSQNFFPTEPETGRYDAGRGLLLFGNGHGNFRCVSGQESGLEIYGDQRGCAVCDYDHDGRLDLAVTQNAHQTKLYHNQGAKPGLRIRLRGSGHNPDGIGATVRLVFGERLGAAEEIHCGSGYWSQDSAISVLGAPEPPTAVWVRWPGGSVTTSSLPQGAREVQIEPTGVISNR